MYVTDSGRSAIFKVERGTAELWMEANGVNRPNAIMVDGKQLLVGNSGDGLLKAIDLKTKEVSTVAAFPNQPFIDGIVRVGKKELLISDYKGKLYWLVEGKDPKLLLDISVQEGNCADIGYNPKEGIIYIPNYQGQEVKAYKLDRKQL